MKIYFSRGRGICEPTIHLIPTHPEPVQVRLPRSVNPPLAIPSPAIPCNPSHVDYPYSRNTVGLRVVSVTARWGVISIIPNWEWGGEAEEVEINQNPNPSRCLRVTSCSQRYEQIERLIPSISCFVTCSETLFLANLHR